MKNEILKADQFEDNQDQRKKKSGAFQRMSKERRTEIARLGGLATSKNRSHMAAIGARGGKSVSQDRAWMATIGQMGGKAAARAE